MKNLENVGVTEAVDPINNDVDVFGAIAVSSPFLSPLASTK